MEEIKAIKNRIKCEHNKERYIYVYCVMERVSVNIINKCDSVKTVKELIYVNII